MTSFLTVPASHLWWIVPSVVFALSCWTNRRGPAPVPVPVRVRVRRY